ncbi:hypothetical protein Tco_0973549 [Tanacetum coccineum]
MGFSMSATLTSSQKISTSSLEHFDVVTRNCDVVSMEYSMLGSLPKSFDNSVMNYNMNGWDKTLGELHAMLKTNEKNLSSKNLVPSLNFVRSLTKDDDWFHYGKIVHWKRNCPSYLVEVKKNKDVGSSSKSGLISIQNMEMSAIDIEKGNDNCGVIEAIRSYSLTVHSVHIEWHDMVQDGDPLLQACDENEHPHTATCQCCKKGIKVQNDLKEFHEEMREIQPLANAATQRRKK